MDGVLIHPTAIVSQEARIGTGVRIGPYSIVEGGVSIGDGSVLEAFVRIREHVVVGRNCHIHENTILGGIPQDHDFAGEVSFVRIADDVVIRENATIHRATGEGAETFVGRGTMLMEGVHLGHNVYIGAECTVANKVGFSGHVKVGDYAVISGLTGFHQFTRVGSYSMVGGLTKIVKDVPPYSMVDGRPGRVYGLNTVGLRRRGFSQEQRCRIKHAYKILYDRALGRKKALDILQDISSENEFACEIAAFVQGSRRGLSPWTDAGHGEDSL